MRRQLIIRLKPTLSSQGEQQVRWLRVEDTATEPPIVNLGTLREAAAQALGCQVVVLVPSTDVVMTRAKLPTQNRAKMLQAIPFLLEEQSAADVEGLHFAVGERAADGSVAVAVVDRARMREWQQQLQEAGVHADVLLPEAMALPYKDGEWAWLREADQSLLRVGADVGLGVDAANDAAMLQLVLREHAERQPAQLQVIECRGEAGGLPALPEGVQAHSEECPGGLMQWLATTHADFKLVINLLQGDFGKREQWQKYFRPWRATAALLGVWLAIYLIGAGIDGWRYAKQADAAASQVEQAYKEAFPDAKKIVNARVQMERKLQELRGGNAQGAGFLSMLADVGPQFKGESGVNFRGLRYRPGVLEAEVDAPNLQALDQIKKNLSETKGLAVEIQAATSKDNKIESRLVIKGK